MNAYLFPIFVTLSYYVYFQKKTEIPTVCFVCNGSDGHILGYAISVGAPEVSLFERAILHLKSTEYTKKYSVAPVMNFKSLPATLAGKSFWYDTNRPTHSLNWRVKSKSTIVDHNKIGEHLLPYLYDWTIEDFDMLRQRLLAEIYQPVLNMKHVLELIDLAVKRFNKHLAEGQEFEVLRKK